MMPAVPPSTHTGRDARAERSAPVRLAGAMLAIVLALSGCHHAPVKSSVVLPALPPPSQNPVMVSVPPPTHRSTPASDTPETVSGIPVVKPVPQPKRRLRRAAAAPAQTAASTPAPAAPETVAPQQPQPTAPTASQTLGQLTTDTDASAANRESSGQAVRSQRDRLNGLSASVQSANATQVDQIRRFVKASVDAWNASDYEAAMTLATKAKVLLDDLPK